MKADAGPIGVCYFIFFLIIAVKARYDKFVAKRQTKDRWKPNILDRPSANIYYSLHPDSTATVLLYTIIDHFSLLYPYWSEYW